MSDEDFEPFVGGPPPDPSERTWRHPSEVAAQAQADAAAANGLSEAGRWALLEWRPRSATSLLIAGSLGAAACLTIIAVFQATQSVQPNVALDPSTIAAPVVDLAPDSVAASSSVATAGDSATPSTTIAGADSATPVPTISPIATAVANDELVAITLQDRVIANGVLANGLLITSASAVGDRLSVTYTRNGNDLVAYLVGVDPFSDLAVFRSSTESQAGRTLQALTGSIDELGVGEDQDQSVEPALDIGDIVMSATITDDGPVSDAGHVLSVDADGVGTNGHPLIDLVDTSIRQPAHMGSAVLDTEGNIVGITISTPRSLASAIDINDALAIAEQLRHQGWANEAWIGFVGIDQRGGVEVIDVTADGPAAVAGLLPGDVIRFFDGAMVQHMGGVTAGLRHSEPGDLVIVVVERDDELLSLQIEAAAYPAEAVSEPVGG